MSFHSNLREIQRDLTSIATDTFNLRRQRRVGSRSVGQGLVETIAAVIRYRTIEQQRDEDGEPLAPLKQTYLVQKLRKGYPATISVATGEMMELAQLIGQVTITRNSASMIYGNDSEMKDEMHWFSEGFRGTDSLGREQDRPERKIYDLGPDGAKAVDRYFDEVATQHIRDLGG